MLEQTAFSSPIRSASIHDRDRIVEILAEAFYDEAVTAWGFPDPKRRKALLPMFFGAIADDVLRRGEVYLTRDGIGVRLFLTPSSPPAAGSDGGAWLRDAVGEYADERMVPLFRSLEERRPRTPSHYHLAFSAVLPAFQCQGRGTALLRAVLERADAEQVGVYVESTTTRSQRLMLRHGFAPLPPIVMPRGPSLYPSWRDPLPESGRLGGEGH